ncbi:schlafen family member 13-like [Mya arenaria]|uniref:schlafen family member 13-like n=1 Tax=Mya arenaria TaxID=6604 RepID=UPI0022E8EC82|nr:schlafen family member 13-like [Mya arenaria]
MSLDAERERKRRSSGSTTLTAQHVTDNLGSYGEVILHCTVNITRGIRECGNTIVLKHVCALLNSGGGILHMRNLDAERGVVLSKHLDTWWSGMEIKMAEILSHDDICNYFDLVGNHDDRDLYLFVKTAEHLCTLKYHCRLPTDTATHDVTYQSLMRLLVERGEPGTLEDLPLVPDRYVFGRSASELKKETKQIQFKQLCAAKNKQKGTSTLPERVCGLMVKYVSAFANHAGGHIYFGIADTRANVVGEEMTHADQRNLEQLIAGRMRNMIWGDRNVPVSRGVHWDVNFYPVENAPKKTVRVVVVVSVVRFPGGVFTHCPVSSYVSTSGRLEEFTFTQWRDAVLNPLRDVPELHNRFQKLMLLVPRAPLIFTLPNTVDTIRQKVLQVKMDTVQPRQYIESYAIPQYREAIRAVLNFFKGQNSIIMGMECWGVKIPMAECADTICDVAIVTEFHNVHVLTFSTAYNDAVIHHSQSAAAILKTRLVQHGGCTEKFSVVSHVLDITNQDILHILETQMAGRDIYPSHFAPSKRKFDKILNSLVICMGSYMAKSQVVHSINQNGYYYFLLTHDQFELLWTQQFTKELWVHGPAGAGKTVAAAQMIQELRRRGCRLENILYLAENEKLCDFVKSHNLCLVTTRRQILAESQDPRIMDRKYGHVCNVIIDEVQNFKDRDGDWYSLAQQIANQNPPNKLHRCSNYFWLFMDYSQKVHKFKAGLPAVIGKNNFMLSEVSRSTKEIFDFTSRLMMASENVEGLTHPGLQSVNSVPKLAHNFSSGKGVDILSCKEDEMRTLLSRVLSGLLQNGVHQDDIAILVGKRKELDHLQTELSSLNLDKFSVAGRKDSRDINHMTSRRSVEEHLQSCGSDRSLQHDRSRSRSPSLQSIAENPSSMSLEDVSDDSFDESFEISNPFDVLAQGNLDSVEQELPGELNNQYVAMETGDPVAKKQKVTFYRYDSSVDESDSERPQKEKDPKLSMESKEDSVSKEIDGVAIDTVRRFSGLDKAAVIGINPYVNEEHADFSKFLLSLATRAKDNLVIITTSDNVKQRLDKLVN